LSRRTFRLDRSQGKILGVCAGLAEHSGIDATIIRVALVLLTIAGGWPWTVIAYVLVALLARPKSDAAGIGRDAAREAREGLDSVALRMRAIEHHAASTNSRLAREIEELR
jgi:phage shock protein C